MGALVSWIIIGSVIIWGYQSCSEETWETDEYQYGYDDGYNDGYYKACKAFERELPSNLYSRYEPYGCG